MKFFLVNNDVNEFGGIPELGRMASSSKIVIPENNNDGDIIIDDDDGDDQSDSTIDFENAPYMTWVWMDHERKCKIVNVAVPMITGIKNINFSISEDGSKIFINYCWPSAIFKPKELFSDEIYDTMKISPDHPKIHSMSTHLLSSGITEKSNPTGRIVIKLPIRVMREEETWTKKPIKKDDGTRIVLLEFKGYGEKNHIKCADTTISFD